MLLGEGFLMTLLGKQQIKQGTTLIYRGKAYATSQVDYTTPHTLNENQYNQYADPTEVEQKYTIIT